MNGKNSVLVLGATGGIGGEVARRLLAAGWDKEDPRVKTEMRLD